MDKKDTFRLGFNLWIREIEWFNHRELTDKELEELKKEYQDRYS